MLRSFASNLFCKIFGNFRFEIFNSKYFRFRGRQDTGVKQKKGARTGGRKAGGGRQDRTEEGRTGRRE